MSYNNSQKHGKSFIGREGIAVAFDISKFTMSIGIRCGRNGVMATVLPWLLLYSLTFDHGYAGNIQGMGQNGTLTIGFAIPWTHEWPVGGNMASTIVVCPPRSTTGVVFL